MAMMVIGTLGCLTFVSSGWAQAIDETALLGDTGLMADALPEVAPRDGPDDAGIINGAPADEDDYEAAGAVLVDVGGVQQVICTSSLIAPDVVLLAAHCVDPQVLGSGTTPLTFYWTREPDLSAFNGMGNPALPEDAVLAKATVMHPDWAYAGLEMGLALNSDIALMFLAEPVLDVPYGYLPTEEEAEQIVAGSEVGVVGWGQTAQNGPAGVKYWGESDISSLADYEFHVGAATDAVRHCHGDSGGPTFMTFETDTTVKERIIGVVSHSYDTSDCTTTGGVQTRVDYFLDWIEDEMGDACADDTRVWCDVTGLPEAPVPVTDLSPDDIKALKKDIRVTACGSLGLATGAWWLPLLLVARRRR